MTAIHPLAAPAGAVPELGFRVAGVEPHAHAAAPTLRFALEVSAAGGTPVRAVSLTVTVRVDVSRRDHPPDSHEALAELFGLPRDWGRSMKPLAWTQATVQVPPFTGGTTVPLLVPCGTDAELAVTKYLRAARDGSVPLDLLFNGTVFYQDPAGGLRAAALPWTTEAAYDLPVALWHGLVERYHQGRPWLRLAQDTYDRLDAYRAHHVLGSADDALRALLDRSGAR